MGGVVKKGWKLNSDVKNIFARNTAGDAKRVRKNLCLHIVVDSSSLN
jgi:hypothetical protein